MYAIHSQEIASFPKCHLIIFLVFGISGLSRPWSKCSMFPPAKLPRDVKSWGHLIAPRSTSDLSGKVGLNLAFDIILETGHSRPLFLYFGLFNAVGSKQWLDSNRVPLVSKATNWATTIASLLSVSVKRLHVAYVNADGWGEGPRALVTSLKNL